MTSKRHAKPTPAALTARMYRKLLKMDDILQDLAPAVSFLSSTCRQTREDVLANGRRLDAMRVLADHCARLLREKETLQRQLAIEIGKSYTVTGDELAENLYKTESHKL